MGPVLGNFLGKPREKEEENKNKVLRSFATLDKVPSIVTCCMALGRRSSSSLFHSGENYDEQLLGGGDHHCVALNAN